jgi:DegV family protein with EDD domain
MMVYNDTPSIKIIKVNELMKIVTDSAADLPAAEVNELGINVVPLMIHFPDGEIKSSDIDPDEFYNKLEAMFPVIPTTSLPSPGTFISLFEELAKDREQVLAVHISSGLSGTIQSARLAIQELPELSVSAIDTMTLSGGERFQVLAAYAAAKAGWAMDSIHKLLKNIQQQCEVVFTLDTLDYLARGGRIGRVEALAGSLLRIKPVINVSKTDGKYNTVGKARTISRAEEIIVDHLVRSYGDTPLWISVMHGRFAEQAEVLAHLVREKLNCAKLEILRVSPVLGVHTGPGVVGTAVLPVSLVTELGLG